MTIKYKKAQPQEEQQAPQQYAPWERPPLPITEGLGIYARQSSAKQVKHNIESNEMQTEGLVQYAKDLGWTDEIITVFAQDMARSGKLKIVDREGMLTLIDLIRQGLIKAVLAAKEDRLFRDETALEYNTFIQVCKEHNCLVIIPPFTIYNFANKRDVKEFRYQCEKAADFLDDYVGRLHDLRDRAILKGNYAGGFIPIGATVDRRKTITNESGTVVPNPNWKKFVRYEPHAEIIDWCLEVYYEIRSLNGIVREAERLGKRFPDFPPEIDPRNRRIASKRIDDEKGGYLITIELLKYVFSNAFYAGHYVRNGQIIRENDHEPIVKNLDHFKYAFSRVSKYTLDGEERENFVPRRNYQKESDEATLLKYVVSQSRENQIYVKFDEKTKNVKWAYIVTCMRQNGVQEYQGRVSAQFIDYAFVARFREKIAQIKSHTDYSAEIQRERAEQEARRAVQQTRLEVIKLERANILEELTAVPPPNLPEEIRKRMTLTPEAKQNLRLQDWELAAEQQAIEAELTQKPGQTKAESKALRYKHLVLEHADHWETYSMSEKHKFLEQVVKEINIYFPTPHWIVMKITWINPEWGIDTGYLWDKGRKGANPIFSEAEIETLKTLYPTGTQREVLEALPMRTWQSLMSINQKLKIPRKRQYSNDPIPHFWSMEDITFAEQIGIDTSKMLMDKFAYWSAH